MNAEWLLTGQGSMLKIKCEDSQNAEAKNFICENKVEKQDCQPQISLNPNIGKPYYDVDFIGGFNEVFNSQVSIPTNNIVIKGFESATLWCNVTGHSMEPKINHGDIIALKECCINDIQYGEIYAVVLDTIRTVKILRKSSDPNRLRFIPINISNFDEQEYEKKRIIKIFEVIGSVSKFF